jgi:hypothetical protein
VIRIDRETAVIVCAGPSLDSLSPLAWQELAKAGAIVSVNGAAAADACANVPFTHLAAMDVCHGLFDRVPRLEAIWRSTTAQRITSADDHETAAEAYIIEVDEADGVYGWSDDRDGGYKGGSTGMIVGNWLGNRGFRTLAYVGLDMHPNDGRHAGGAGTHFSGFADDAGRHARVCRSWGRFCSEAEKRGIDAVNLTPNTALAEMRRVDVPNEWLVRAKSLAFVACIERGELEEKALLLCRSIRRFGGAFGGAPIFTFQPRAGTTITAKTASQLDALGVRHLDEVLNRDFAHYAIANKIFAAARAEDLAQEEVVVFVDSDSIITSEPVKLALAPHIDAAVRPVDIHRMPEEPDEDAHPFWRTRHRRMSSSGPGDRNDVYWTRMYDLLKVLPSSAAAGEGGRRPGEGTTRFEPYVETTCSRQRIRAYFNSGLIAVRRSAGLFAQWRDDFLQLVAANHIPRELHYMDQLSLAATLTRIHSRVDTLDGAYNYPLPGRSMLAEPYGSMPLEQLVHVHYNRSLRSADALANIEPPIDEDGVVARWLAPHLPLVLETA